MPGRLLLHPPTALEYFASLVAEDDGLPLLEAAISVAHDEYPTLDCQGVTELTAQGEDAAGNVETLTHTMAIAL